MYVGKVKSFSDFGIVMEADGKEGAWSGGLCAGLECFFFISLRTAPLGFMHLSEISHDFVSGPDLPKMFTIGQEVGGWSGSRAPFIHCLR